MLYEPSISELREFVIALKQRNHCTSLVWLSFREYSVKMIQSSIYALLT